jgi:hypothetical protein
MGVVPQITPEVMFGLWKQQTEDAGLDLEAVQKGAEDSPALKKVKEIAEKMEQLQSTPPQNGLAQEQTAGMAVSAGATGAPQGGGGPGAAPQPPAVLQRFAR